MMENKVNIERFPRGARRRRVAMRACPHCGGDVRLNRDIYGAYLQCLQCSRELQPDALAMPARHAPAATPLSPQVEALEAA